MKKVVVVTDSTATVPAELVRKLDIRVVPILLAVDGRTFRDGVDITTEQVYGWLRDGRLRPTTSAPSVGDFLRAYASAAREASGIVSIHLSPKFSAIHEVARTASELIDEVPIRVVNCRSAAMGQGFVVLEAARAASASVDLESVVSRAQRAASRVNLVATIDTLDYLHRGGRIGGAAALVGTVLRIKPVLYVADGHVGVFAKPRTKSRAVQAMLEHVEEKAGGRALHAAVLHADALGEAEALRAQIASRFDCVELYVTELTPVMGVHTGPGVLGIAFFAE